MSSDKGSAFTDHEAVAGILKSDFHFAHPCAPWQRGANENTNGLIRQRFPKTYDLATIKTSRLARVMRQLNNRPRKCLGMKTPMQYIIDNHKKCNMWWTHTPSLTIFVYNP